MAKSNRPANGPSTTGEKSGKGRGNNPPKSNSGKSGNSGSKGKK